MNPPTIKIDPEIAALKQDVSVEKYKSLERDILLKGCLKAVEVWKGSIVDGQKRFEICRKHGISFTVKHACGTSRSDICRQVCKTQLARTDLTSEWRKYLIGRQYLYERNVVIETVKLKLGEGEKIPPSEKIATIAAEEAASYNSISAGTVRKYYLYASAMDKIQSASPGLFRKLIYSEIKASHENTIELAHLSADDIRHVHESIQEDGKHHIVLSDIKHGLAWRRYKLQIQEPPVQKKTAKSNVAEIKKMPKYDPDAEFSTLALTIPSWMNLITKTQNNADFRRASKGTKLRLYHQLGALNGMVDAMMVMLKEVPDDI